MYPFVRMIKEMIHAHRAAPLGVFDEHVTQLRCWPWDLDMAVELNNGRTLTLMDLGRLPLFSRNGLFKAIYGKKWYMTMAGVTVRYRRRVRTMEPVTLRSRIVGWDDRFVYIEQAMFRRDGECANHALYRAATANKQGIVPPDQVFALIGHTDPSPTLPDWIQNWIGAEATRPWPPMQE